MAAIEAFTQTVHGRFVWERAAYTMLVVQRGRLTLAQGSGSVTVSARQALLLQPGSPYSCEAQAETTLCCVLFSREAFFRCCLPVLEGCTLLTDFFVHEQRSTISYLHFEGVDDEMDAVLAQMLQEAQSQRELCEMVELCSLVHLLLLLSRNCMMNAVLTQNPGEQLTQQVMSYLVENCATATLKEVSAHFQYHPNTISGLIRKQMGKSFQELRQQIRLSRAARLILEGSMSVTEAARDCGYSNMSNFYVQFERIYGMTPGDYAAANSREPQAARTDCGR